MRDMVADLGPPWPRVAMSSLLVFLYFIILFSSLLFLSHSSSFYDVL